MLHILTILHSGPYIKFKSLAENNVILIDCKKFINISIFITLTFKKCRRMCDKIETEIRYLSLSVSNVKVLP